MSWLQLRATRSLLRHATRGERLEVLGRGWVMNWYSVRIFGGGVFLKLHRYWKSGQHHVWMRY